jgi:hypothetical protein
MGKYSLGTWMASLAVAVIAGYNVNIVTGIASLVAVWGVAYMISGTLESVLKIVVTAFAGK